MKNLTWFCLAAALLGVTLATPVRGQSLAELARKERAKHSKEKPAKVYTNDNIPKSGPLSNEKVEANMAQPSAEATPSTAPTLPQARGQESKEAQAGEIKEAESKQKTREYWQSKFKAARQALAEAKERADLNEAETTLLERQVAQELDPGAKSQLQAKLDAKQAEAKDQQAAVEEAKKALSELEQEFKESGAPEDWSKTD